MPSPREKRQRKEFVAVSFIIALFLLTAVLSILPANARESADETAVNPVVQSIFPPRSAFTATLDTAVTATYDAAMDATTVTSHTFAIHGMQSGLVIETHGMTNGDATIIANPANPFHPGELVQASATTALLNTSAIGALKPTVWQFRTAASGGSAVFDPAFKFKSYNDRTDALMLGDMDGDGDLDVVMGNRDQQNMVYLNNGDSTFPAANNPFGPSNDYTHALALGDVDGDGDLDVAVGNENQQNRVYLNNGDGTFAATGNTFGPSNDKTFALALGDVDGDGDLDVAVGNDNQQNRVYLNNGDGTFAATGNPFGPYDDATHALAMGDVDGDGDLDMAVGNYYQQQDLVYLNNGDGTFAATGNTFGPSNNYTRALALGDMDGDGDLDVAVGNTYRQNLVYLNNGDGSFSATGNSFGPSADATFDLALGDVDGDGDLDAAVSNEKQQNWVYLNNGDGSFAVTGRTFGSSNDPTYALAMGDVDGDDDLDLAVGNYRQQSVIYRNRHLVDLQIEKSVAPRVAQPGDTITYTLRFENSGVLTATGVVISDIIPAGISNLAVISSGALITDTVASLDYVWDVQDLAPGDSGAITITGQLLTPPSPCSTFVNTAAITSVDPDEVPANNSDTVVHAINAPLHIGSIDPGATLTVNGTAAPAGSVFCFIPGETVTFQTTFGGQTYEDMIEAHYYLGVSVHAQSYDASPGTIYLDTDLNYTPYDIFVITSSATANFSFDMAAPPDDDPVKIIGLHAMVPTATIEALGRADQTGTPRELAELFYGTVENAGQLTINTTCADEIGSAFNKIVAHEVEFSSGCSDDADVMIQELKAGYAESDDTEISWWRMELIGQFYADDYEGYALNDELPELVSLDDDPMLWFKSRSPDKWALYPLIDIHGQGYANAWEFDNYKYEDYNFWEMHLGGDFHWYNDNDNKEYAHFLGPVMEMDSFSWTYYYDNLYLNFFGDNNTYSYNNDRFDGDNGSAGADFWNPLLTSSYGYSGTNGNIISPIAVLKLREGSFYTEDHYESYETYLQLAKDQDLLILSGTDHLTFTFDYGVYFEQGSNAHWVVEDGLTYSNDVPTGDDFHIDVPQFSNVGLSVTVVATNNYKTSGDASVSTMYLAYRAVDDYGRQLTKAPMTYGSEEWSVTTSLPQPGEYDFYIVALENDSEYGKVVERRSVVSADVGVDKNVTPASAAPGETIIYTLSFANSGNIPATGVVITDIIPVSLTIQSVISSGANITNTVASPAYVWDVQDLQAGQGGVITITAVLAEPLAAGTFNNTATIATTSPDGNPANDSASVPVTVLNVPPVAVPDTYTTSENTPLVVPLPGILGNDTDANGDGLTAAVNADVSNGVLALAAGGSFVYTPTPDFCGTDGFTYHASDGTAASNIAAVTLNVICVTPHYDLYLPVIFKP